MDWDAELEARGVSPLSEADVLSRPDQYHTALELGFALMNGDDTDD